MVGLEENEENGDGEEEQVFRDGELIIGRYLVKVNCGSATFSSCYAVHDTLTNKDLCLKVIK